MTWTFIFLMFVLKIPIIGLLWIVWWAIRAQPESGDPGSDDDGGSRKPRHPRPPLFSSTDDPLKLRIERLQCANGRCAARLNTERFKHRLNVLLDRGFRDAENRRDVRVRLALGHPE